MLAVNSVNIVRTLYISTLVEYCLAVVCYLLASVNNTHTNPNL